MARLTDRQLQILQCASEGMTARETAVAMGITHWTVRKAISRRTETEGQCGILERLQAHNITQAVAMAIRNGWIE